MTADAFALMRRLMVLAVAVAAPTTFAAGAPRVLTWDDMMPAGEAEVLEQLYRQYINELLAPTSRDVQAGGPMARGDVPVTGGLAAAIAEGSPLDAAVQIGTFNVVPDLDGQTVRLPGYVVPLDFTAQGTLDPKGTISEFLLVPYFGACIHVPPPPPNQTVYVTSTRPITVESLSSAVWVEGVLSTGKRTSTLADAAYSLALTKIEPYAR